MTDTPFRLRKGCTKTRYGPPHIMRVLHIGKYYPPHSGGIESFTRDLATGLSLQGVECLMLVHRVGKAPPEKTAGVAVHTVPAWGHLFYTPLAPAFPLHHQKCVRAFRPDVVHIHMPNVAGYWPLLLRLRVPIVVHWHADVVFPNRKIGCRAAHVPYRILERWLLRRSDAIVATSESYMRSSSVLAPFKEKCRIIPLGLDPDRLSQPDEKKIAQARRLWLQDREGFLLASAGRFAHYKGFDVLIRAVERVPSCVAVIAGSGETKAAMERLVREKGLEGRVYLPGRLSDKELHTLMAACDAFCLPSVERTEAFGVVLLEAMYFGRPLISTDIPGSATGWINVRESTGLVVQPNDVEGLAGAITNLLYDKEGRAAMGAAARRRFERDFQISRVAEDVAKLYVQVTETRKHIKHFKRDVGILPTPQVRENPRGKIKVS